MSQKNVLVLFGGHSPEHDVSLSSARTIVGALSRHTVIPVYITKAGKWLLYDGKLDNIQGIDWEKHGTPAILSPDRVNRGLLRIVGDKVKTIPVDVAFPILHGHNGEDGTIQGLCQLAGIPYVGCGVMASAVAMDKPVTRQLARSLKIPVPDSLVFSREDVRDDLTETTKKIRYKIGYPCFVKPAVGGSSVGTAKVNNKKELVPALTAALEISSRVVVEKTIKGREIEVGILGVGSEAKASVPGEIKPDREFYDYEAKYLSNTTEIIVPAEIDEETIKTIHKYALDIFSAINGCGMARADFFLTEESRVVFNEINTIPGFTANSIFPKMWEASGVSCRDLVEGLLSLACENANG